MDFFESQDIARRNTKLLLLLFGLAVISLILLTNALIFVFINFQDSARIATGSYYFSWQLFGAISGSVILLVLLASAIRLHALNRGGSAVAEMLDGELLSSAQGDANKQKLLNIVEEMAIASGVPVPPVYLIRDNAINAFAAGYSTGDAVIGITLGAIENLNRDELQGVIAHEFSHILHGDMRLNIRLMGVLYGILMMALIGRMLLYSSHAGRRRDKSHAGVIGLGIGLMLVGYLGQFFGNLIKAAVSRQREYLADAAAVQYTRNPRGIADALKRIGGYQAGSHLAHPDSQELSHTFFSEAVEFSFSKLMTTHPPLSERIQRIEPGWTGQFLDANSIENHPSKNTTNRAETSGAMGFAGNDNLAAKPGTRNQSKTGIAIDVEHALQTIGNPDESQLALARDILASLPSAYVDAAHEPYSARALVYLLNLDKDQEIREHQLAHLQAAADFGVYEALTGLLQFESQLNSTMRLPLLEMSLPTLRQLSYKQYKLFLGNLDVLVRADNKIGLSEWVVQKMLHKHLGEAFEGNRSSPKHKNLKPVKEHCAVLLSMLAYCDKEAEIEPAAAFKAGADALDLDIELLPSNALSFNRLNLALDTLADLYPLRKPKLLKACIKTIIADNKISVIEHELMRAIADTLECPMPPLSTV